MKFQVLEKKAQQLERISFLLDNDFLSILLNDEEAFVQFIDFSQNKNSLLVIDPLTKFEFLRDVFAYKIRDTKERFILNQKMFMQLPIQHQSFAKQHDNAMIL